MGFNRPIADDEFGDGPRPDEIQDDSYDDWDS